MSHSWVGTAVAYDVSFARLCAGTAERLMASLGPATAGASMLDAVAANFVVNHTPDPRASVRDMRRVTRPGGRLALTIWTGAVTPMNQLWNDVLATASARPLAGKTLPPDKDFERTTAGLGNLMTEAGLDDVAVQEVHWLFRIAADDLWRAVAGGVATIGRTFQAQPPPIQVRMRKAFAQLVHERYPDGELRLPTSALLASAWRDPSRRR